LKDGDANTKFFHAKVNGRRRKKFIQRIANNQGWVTDFDGKESLTKSHFSTVMGKGPPRLRNFSWAGMVFPPTDLEDLGESFSELEVLAAIKSMRSDKAPGSDGFTGAFYKACWETIKHDVMRVVHLFSNLHAENFHWLNSANIALLPKKEGAEAISDFHPISLIHGVAKIIAKMMSIRLAPHMDTLILHLKVPSSKPGVFTTTSWVFEITLGGFTVPKLQPSSSSLTSRRRLTR
jgi:hypothetical protein